jgi:mannose-1-phosphate guanylyltransferase
MAIIGCIWAGGSGTRLAPLSIPQAPKQFLPLMPGQASSFVQTLRWLTGPTPLVDRIIVNCSTQAHRLIVDAINQWAQTQPSPVPVVVVEESEPIGSASSTIAFLALALADDTVICTPADHRFSRPDLFRQIVSKALATIRPTKRRRVRRDVMAVFGVPAFRADSTLGYFSTAFDPVFQDRDIPSFVIRDFHPYPDRAVLSSECSSFEALFGVRWWVNLGLIGANVEALCTHLERRDSHRVTNASHLWGAHRPVQWSAKIWADARWRMAKGESPLVLLVDTARHAQTFDAVGLDTLLLKDRTDLDVRLYPTAPVVGWSDLGTWPRYWEAILHHCAPDPMTSPLAAGQLSFGWQIHDALLAYDHMSGALNLVRGTRTHRVRVPLLLEAWPRWDDVT